MSGRRLKLTLPPPDHPYYWQRLQNLLYVLGEDELFRWSRGVRETVERAERQRRRAA